MHIDGTDCHDFLAISLAEVSEQESNEVIELLDLFLRIVLHRVLVTLFKS